MALIRRVKLQVTRKREYDAGHPSRRQVSRPEERISRTALLPHIEYDFSRRADAYLQRGLELSSRRFQGQPRAVDQEAQLVVQEVEEGRCAEELARVIGRLVRLGDEAKVVQLGRQRVPPRVHIGPEGEHGARVYGADVDRLVEELQGPAQEAGILDLAEENQMAVTLLARAAGGRSSSFLVAA